MEYWIPELHRKQDAEIMAVIAEVDNYSAHSDGDNRIKRAMAFDRISEILKGRE